MHITNDAGLTLFRFQLTTVSPQFHGISFYDKSER